MLVVRAFLAGAKISGADSPLSRELSASAVVARRQQRGIKWREAAGGQDGARQAGDATTFAPAAHHPSPRLSGQGTRS